MGKIYLLGFVCVVEVLAMTAWHEWAAAAGWMAALMLTRVLERHHAR